MKWQICLHKSIQLRQDMYRPSRFLWICILYYFCVLLNAKWIAPLSNVRLWHLSDSRCGRMTNSKVNILGLWLMVVVVIWGLSTIITNVGVIIIISITLLLYSKVFFPCKLTMILCLGCFVTINLVRHCPSISTMPSLVCDWS